MEANANRTAGPQPDEQTRRLQEREATLKQELAAVAVERERLQQLTARQLHEVDEATTELRQQYEALQIERAQFHEQKERTQSQWQERWQAEWSRVQQREAEVAAERVALDKTRREANGDVELQRRQLQAGWSDLRREQQAWQERLHAEQALLQRQQQHAVEQQQVMLLGEQALVQERALQETTLHGQRQELGYLEMRIVHWRAQLEALRGEAALLEAALCHTPPGLLGEVPPEVAVALPTAELVLPAALPREQTQLIDLITQISTSLADEVQRIQEHQDRLLELHEAWRTNWDKSLGHLTEREDDLQQREHQLQPREDAVQARERKARQRETRLSHYEQELICREVRLEQQRRSLTNRWARLRDAIKARHLALHRRRLVVHRLGQEWLRVRTQEGDKLLQARTACERARQEYLTAKESLRRRQQALDERERRLLQRELAMTQVEQQLVAQDHNPAAAQRILDRLRNAWEKAVANQLRAMTRREEELARRATHLEDFRGKLLNERQNVEEMRRTVATTQVESEGERAQLEAQRQQLAAELHQLRTDREHLRRRVRDQERNLEQLTLLLLDSQSEPPPLALAA